jgi:hypothetical protein
VFSLGDPVQSPLGAHPHPRGEGRTLPDSAAISNRLALDDGRGSEPSHGDLTQVQTWTASQLDALLA